MIKWIRLARGDGEYEYDRPFEATLEDGTLIELRNSSKTWREPHWDYMVQRPARQHADGRFVIEGTAYGITEKEARKMVIKMARMGK